ncbi:alginate export family protein [Paraferrimonas haliotis]|uniref:Alginate export domain-containing protein n=1 Tax=Paraferrimonas haliotis TaxID=2013866 RepID=A0AA37WWY7_9GAMM|nr:alginate export family protein [Paraferrimonas haliotis]GLS82819.1 hypothetical protein GCM10007894_07960 [Paraferrimonas haliotis]
MLKQSSISLTIAAALVGFSAPTLAEATSVTEALTQGSVKGDVRLRFEGVSQDNDLKDAQALTIRTRLGYTTADFSGFSAMVEFEDSRPAFGVNNYNDTINGDTHYSVIADPKVTEVDQAFVQYKNDMLLGRVGRQVLAIDNQRFIGHVGWRQDRQTFDAANLVVTPIKDLSLQYAYITKRNRIFADVKDVDSKDHVLNASYNTPFGKVSGYGYLLEEDKAMKNGLDTYGVRFAGAQDLDAFKLGYQAEYAQQKSTMDTMSYDANYYFLEAKAGFKPVSVALGYEVLGSDDGNYGFSTPLATLHKFNGWSDQFLGTPKQGLKDLYATVSGQFMKVNWLVTYHDFSADKETMDVKDLGKEINASLTTKFTDNLSGGIKYAAYMAGDKGAGKVDTDKVWVWAGLTF